MTPKQVDILVIGGGPAGSTISTLLQQKGRSVAMLEKDRHPRFHIGESLLPMNVPIFERLGVLDEVRAIGVPKFGADFTIGNSGDDEKVFYFANALGSSPPAAFEVRRSEFDELLFRRAAREGVDTREETKVKRVTPLADGRHEVEAVNATGEHQLWNAGFLVDASGRDTFLSTSNRWKFRNEKHVSAAIFGHFHGAVRRKGNDQGNISLYWFPHGWMWMIPLRDDVMSVGAVCRPEYLKTRSGTLDEFLRMTIDSVAETRERMRYAVAAVPAQATGNYSYLSRRMFGPGYLMIGDAYAFIDPVFSSGVYLAMNSAEQGVSVAEAWLSGDREAYARACRRYQANVRRGLSVFSWFIYRFTSPAMRFLMSNPRNVLKVVQTVISMLAGDVFSNQQLRRRLIVFKTIYSVSWLLRWRDSISFHRSKRESIRAALADDK